MSYQEAALYGDLVLFLRDRAAELLAADGDVEAQRQQLDLIIRDWFFTPQEDLHGCAPRDLIWAERREEPNPLPVERLDEFFFDDCPICQHTRDEIIADLEAGVDPCFHWHYDDGGYPLIAQYDPEGWDACYAEMDASMGKGNEAVFDEINRLLDEDEWHEAAELAYQALVHDPDRSRAANALLRCYLHRDALREMERVQFRLFHPEDPDYDAPHQQRRRRVYTYRCLSRASAWMDWIGGDHIPLELADVADKLHEGYAALNAAYCVGEHGAYERARAAFAEAEAACAERRALTWYLARLYADHGFFAECLETLEQLKVLDEAGFSSAAYQLWIEVSWWHTYGWQVPWLH